MLPWIEAQSISVIALVMFAFCFALAAVAYSVGAVLSRRAIGEELKTVSPVTLTPLAVILGLLIAFIAGRIWDNVARANDHVGAEVSALSEVVLVSNALAPEIRDSLRDAIKRHIVLITEKDWPEMAAFQTNPASQAEDLKAALMMLLSYKTAEQSQDIARQRASRPSSGRLQRAKAGCGSARRRSRRSSGPSSSYWRRSSS
jgi:hypothetical protein